MPRMRNGDTRIREIRRKDGIAHFNFVDGKLTLWDEPHEGTLPVAFAIRNGHIAFQEKMDD